MQPCLWLRGSLNMSDNRSVIALNGVFHVLVVVTFAFSGCSSRSDSSNSGASLDQLAQSSPRKAPITDGLPASDSKLLAARAGFKSDLRPQPGSKGPVD